MKLSFASARLKKTLSDSKAMAKAYGHVLKPLQLRLALLAAVDCLANVPHARPERRHQPEGDRAGQFAVDLRGGWRLVFRPDHNPPPCLPDGGFDLKGITAIEILAIEDYH